MLSTEILVLIAIIFIFLLLGFLFLMPSGKTGRRRKKRSNEGEQEKDWQAVALKLERHINALRNQIDGMQKKGKILERELIIQKDKYEKVQEKLSQERKWQKKEKGDVEKKTNELIKLKKNFQEAEQNLAQEHGERLRLQKEVKETAGVVTDLSEAKGSLESEIMKLKAKNDSYRQEINELKVLNARISKKHDEATWVAKSQYDKVEQELRTKDKEIEKLKKLLTK